MNHKPIDKEFNPEYIYCLDMAWKDGTNEPVKNKKYSIVENMTLEENGCFYHFNFKGDPETFHAHYGWAFVLSIPSNRAKIERLKTAEEELRQAQTKVEEIRRTITTLSTEEQTAGQEPGDEK